MTSRPATSAPGTPTSVRVEGAVGYLVRRNVRLKAGYQYNWRDGGRERSIGLAGAQLLYWF